MNPATFTDFRQATAALALIVVTLFGWLLWDCVRRWRDHRLDHDRLKRRAQFLLGTWLTWVAALGTNVWFSAWYMLDRPPWMAGHGFIAAMLIVSMTAAMVHIRLATRETWGNWPWILTAIAVALAAWVI